MLKLFQRFGVHFSRHIQGKYEMDRVTDRYNSIGLATGIELEAWGVILSNGKGHMVKKKGCRNRGEARLCSDHFLLPSYIHPEDGNCDVCRNVGTASTHHAAEHRMPNFHIRPGLRKPTDKIFPCCPCATTYGEWRYSSTTLDHGTWWRWVVSFTPRPLYARRRSPRYPLDRRLGRPQSRSGRRGGEKNLLPLSGIKLQPSSQSLHRLCYPGSPTDAELMRNKAKQRLRAQTRKHKLSRSSGCPWPQAEGQCKLFFALNYVISTRQGRHLGKWRYTSIILDFGTW
jgi:hypothetical protein